jgi:GH35 family endo-1,4-beta-xylanase
MKRISTAFCILFPFLSLFSSTLNISFTSKSGEPVFKYVVVYDLDSLNELASSDMSVTDKFSAEVPDNTDVFVLGIASSGKSNSGYVAHEFLPVSKALNSKTGEKTVELVTEPAFQLIFQNAEFPDGELFAVDMNDRFLTVFKLDVTNSSNKSLPAITLPLGKCYAVYILKELPVSGKMIYRMDNKGDGFCSDSQGNLMVDTDKAVAESVVARYEKLINESQVGTTEHLEKLNEIKDLYNKGDYRSSAGEAVFQSEELIFEEALININMYRKGKISVEINDLSGNPVAGIKVEAVPLKTEYKRGVLAGIYDLDPSIFSNAVADGFNFATVGTLWLDVEPTDDSYRWSYIDEVAGNRKIYEMGYELFGHSIIYFLDFVMPEYLKSMDAESLNEEISEHTQALAQHYEGIINEWLVINEAHSISASYGFSRSEITGFTSSVIKVLNEKDPGIIKTINAAPDYFGQSMFTEMFMVDRDALFSMPVYDYFKDLIDHDIDFDVIGQQMYNGGCVTLFKDYGLADSAAAVPVFDLVEMRRNLRKLQTLGKPVYVTEISVPASMNSSCPGMGYWRKEWSEEVQAQFLERLLAVIMGEKDVRLVNYWDMQDKGSFIYKGGLMDADGRKKPAYEAASKAFGDLLKTVEAVSGVDGIAELKLYAGEYEINIDDGNKTEQTTVRESQEVQIEYQTDTFSQEEPDEEAVDDENRKGDESGCALLRI